MPQGQSTAYGSEIAAEMAQLAKPRYHFATGQDLFFARLPYANKDLGAGPRATRFIALAPVDSQGKQKSLHALSLVPASAMDPEALSSIPDGCTPNPYEFKATKREAQAEALPEGDSWRWSKVNKRQRKDGGHGGPGQPEPPAIITGRTDITRDPYSTITARNVPFKASEADIVHFFGQAGKVVDVIRTANRDGKLNTWVSIQYATPEDAGKALQLHNTELMGRTITVDPATASGRKQAPLGVPVEGCWFCLGSSSVDLSLVASVGNEAYVTLDKGAISDYHVLLVPVDHFPSSVSLSPPCFTEMERYLSALRTCYASQGLELVGFERHLALKKAGGNHCHVNVIAVPSSAAKRAKQAFQQATESAGFNLKVLPPTSGTTMAGALAAGAGGDAAATSSQAALRSAVGDSEYFCAILGDGTRLVRPIMRGERFPMNLGREVLADLAGTPERSDWKACSVSEEEEAARTQRFRDLFKAYDIMQ
ncbi:CwfJ C-terminus 1-domain-containing protein-like protein [Dunaliella salina]|uniref:CwfJ C-terminus 1-domain-containing protein-like protein n=1 Tax=Dunaliella salina TaxID=3046 RepID=A0ABQ7GLG1_DUNSA|nr:CwfJ C-terminus 1-domain-containing protein-like protein [Dunaliella salina]|eukprot:KAF5835451.1 CwfJ C-terminus 1-domain-containing protein-like protein [Dunaliella salina]